MFHIRLDASDRADVLLVLNESEITPVFFSASGPDLLVVLRNREDAVYLTMMFR
ncbi:hypothetical protein [Bosea sp. TAF32]|uniref:hypothetical protein n=1 Tax=Bosea sp. TAF32 TaxID=3237482 RepID=UPI003F93E08F